MVGGGDEEGEEGVDCGEVREGKVRGREEEEDGLEEVHKGREEGEGEEEIPVVAVFSNMFLEEIWYEVSSKF